ncbi:PKD domain-containing protein [Algoriphagus mannitolivorans]|uniref:PKD domain-containing protein n=1 Tax=Algoriphagus mannitolivorans TaxID=226504 RepID=UPI001FE1AD19|nr:PKD domain-containing protein [Algoriphagus mannitolivorans]
MKRAFWIWIWIVGMMNISSGFGQIGFPYCETFTTPNTLNETVFGGDALLTNGVLRLTSNQNNQRGFIYINVPFPSTYGLKAEFEYFSYGGLGQFLADGLTVFLFDADTPVFSAGGFGGSLGYAQRNGEPGLSGAYLGIGFDEFGNFGTNSEGRIGGFNDLDANRRAPDAIVLRGPGNGSTDYPFVVGRKVNDVGTDKDGLNPGAQFPISSGGAGTSRVTDPNKVGYRKVFLELQPNPGGVGYFITLRMMVTTIANQPRMVTIFDRPYDFPAPKNLKIGFSASTGGFSNFHEIRNLIVEVSNEEALKNPEGIEIDDYTSCAGQENQFNIKDDEVKLPNINSTIRCLQFFKSQADIKKNEGDICQQARCLESNRFLVLPEGVFRASDNAGGFTFTPNEGFVGKKVKVYYTITDNYGKTSEGNSITLDIFESPKPINIFINGENEPREKIEVCLGENVQLKGIGQEQYSRFEWFRNGELIPGANQSVFSASEEGLYEVWGYNLKGCPAKSKTIEVEYPDVPEIIFEAPLVSCDPKTPVNVTEYILGFDIAKFDYLLKGNNEQFLNNELKSVSKSGFYTLQVKRKNLDCYSEPVEVEIFIQETPLEVDFDFLVLGTDIRDDASGGIFPDDPIEFSDLSAPRGIKWDWDFGDGTGSDDKNPVHVFGKKGQFEVKLTVLDEYGCPSSKTKMVSITKSYRVMMPTGFTPLHSENKTFLPKWKGLVQIELLIFNLWGELIFKTDDLETKGWDGTLEGVLQNPGVYVFRFNGVATDGELVKESGKFSLIR